MVSGSADPSKHRFFSLFFFFQLDKHEALVSHVCLMAVLLLMVITLLC